MGEAAQGQALERRRAYPTLHRRTEGSGQPHTRATHRPHTRATHRPQRLVMPHEACQRLVMSDEVPVTTAPHAAVSAPAHGAAGGASRVGACPVWGLGRGVGSVHVQ